MSVCWSALLSSAVLVFVMVLGLQTILQDVSSIVNVICCLPVKGFYTIINGGFIKRLWYLSDSYCKTCYCCFAGLVGSAYHIVAYQPETALEALTRATSGTATMGKRNKLLFI